jgi:hypothetical protein
MSDQNGSLRALDLYGATETFYLPLDDHAYKAKDDELWPNRRLRR